MSWIGWTLLALIWAAVLTFGIVLWRRERAEQKMTQAAWDEWCNAARESIDAQRIGEYKPIPEWVEPSAEHTR